MPISDRLSALRGGFGALMFGAMTRTNSFVSATAARPLATVFGSPLRRDARCAQAISEALWTKGMAVTLTEADTGEDLGCLSNEPI